MTTILSEAPPLDGLRLFARPTGKDYYPVSIIAQTVCWQGMAVGRNDEITIEYDERSQQASAQAVKWWLKDIGYQRVLEFRNKKLPEYAELGGES